MNYIVKEKKHFFTKVFLLYYFSHNHESLTYFNLFILYEKNY